MTLVAISAAYGAGGSRIAPALAQRIGVPFVDRAIPIPEANRLFVPEEEGKPGWLERALAGFVGAESSVTGPVATSSPAVSEDFRRRSDELLARQAQSGQGVLLGRAAVAVLRDDPRVLRVRLYGPPERRIEQAVRTFGASREAAAEAVRNLDRAHDAYLKQFYGADIDDPALYHLMIDSTVVEMDTCIELIATAARAHSTRFVPAPDAH